MQKRLWSVVALLTVSALVFGACAAPVAAPAAPAAEPAADAGAACASKDAVTLQLKWVAQAQFAGYYAAKAEGFYDDECLDVTVNPGGPDIVPEQVVAGGQAQFGINFCRACSPAGSRAPIWSTSPRSSSAAPCARSAGRIPASPGRPI